MRRLKLNATLIASLLLAASMNTTSFADNTAGAKIHWSYTGKTSAKHWGALDPSFELCAHGDEQSPINIPKDEPISKDALAIHYHSTSMIIVEDGTTDLTLGKVQTVINDGHTIQLNFPIEGTKENIVFNGSSYRLVQFHVHTPSENHVDGKAYPLEIHFVHQGENGKAAVIGVFVKEGEKNPSFEKIIAHLPNKLHTPQIVKGEHIRPLSLLPRNKHYYSFKGSLTTPPCSQGILWIVMAEPITASHEQILELKKAKGGDNARPIQSLEKRSVSYSEK